MYPAPNIDLPAQALTLDQQKILEKEDWTLGYFDAGKP